MTPTSSRGGSGEAPVTHRLTEEARQNMEMPEDELRRKTKSIVDEYLHLNDLKVHSVIIVTSLSSYNWPT